MSKVMFILLMSVSIGLSACSIFINKEDIEKKADLAFEKQDYKKFNNLYTKLKDADKDAALKYIKSKKEDSIFKSSLDLENKLTNLETIQKDVPDLATYANKQSYILNITKISDNLKSDISIIEDPLSDINRTIVVVSSMEEMEKILNPLEKLTTKSSEALSTIEDIDVPKEYNKINDNLVNTIREYDEKLKSKYTYLKENSANIVTSNDLTMDGNYFAMTNSSNTIDDTNKIDTELKFAIDNLVYRLNSVRKKLEIN